MVLRTQGSYHYGDSQADLLDYLIAYSADSYRIEHYADAVCVCGNKLFKLKIDAIVGVTSRICTACGREHYIGDSAEFLDEADLELCECVCGNLKLEVTVGIALYKDSDDVKWVYIGGRCSQCGLVGCYGDWKNEYEDYQDYLAHV